MRNAMRVLGWLAAAVALVALGGVVYLAVAYPKKAPPPEIVVDGTADQVERGRYLFHHVLACVACHAERDTTLAGDPLVPGTVGKENLAWRGEVFPPNVTPAALGDWTDGEIARAIASGIRKDGSGLFPAMPYAAYRDLARDDLAAVVAYMRALEPIPVERPRTRPPVPLNVIARIAPRPADPPERAPEGMIERGAYLATVAACAFCHTPFERHRSVDSLAFAGGHAFEVGEWIVRSANLTPDPRTGIGTWSREKFVDRFRRVASHPERPRRRDAHDPPAVMPWAEHAGMTDEDLEAIYTYLRTVAPVEYEVRRFERVTREEERP